MLHFEREAGIDFVKISIAQQYVPIALRHFFHFESEVSGANITITFILMTLIKLLHPGNAK